MGRFGTALTAILIGLLSAVVFVVVFAVTALPALAVVEDDNAYVTWGVLITCAFFGWLASRFTSRWLLRRSTR
ncbi:MAG TPA: hypothetical protein VEX37_07185 [Thermomicrobiales bacterium]|nr:hypothetical protein [Thermomicrobiales bacterium]